MANSNRSTLSTDDFPDGDVQCEKCDTNFSFDWTEVEITATVPPGLGGHQTKVPDEDWDTETCPACDNTGTVKPFYLEGS